MEWTANPEGTTFTAKGKKATYKIAQNEDMPWRIELLANEDKYRVRTIDEGKELAEDLEKEEEETPAPKRRGK